MLDALLNQRILKLAPKHETSVNAPATFEELCRNVGKLVVWSGASDRTVYGDARVNHAFRAWHDSLHLKLNAPFTVEGETLVALEQARLIGSDAWAQVMLAEVIGQVGYARSNGAFPVDQVEFIKQYLKGGNSK